jgi:hypothetical protein
MKHTLSCITLLFLTSCGYEKSYPNLVDGPSEDQKPPITLEEAKAEVAAMKEERNKLSRS